MSNFIKKSVRPFKKAFGLGDKPAAAVQPAEPTLDEAAKNRDELDRIKRRRGVLANIFGGRTSSNSPAVGVKTLLGQ